VNASLRPARPLIVGVALVSVAALVAAVAFVTSAAGPGAPQSPTASPSAGSTAVGYASPTAPSSAPASQSPASGFLPIDLFAVEPRPMLAPTDAPGDSIFRFDPGRPLAAQSAGWLSLKASGRVALVDGQPTVLLPDADPLAMPRTGQPVPAARTLDVSWTRWIVEPPGSGRDEKGNRYTDLSYWNLCGPGAVAAALYYWQQLTGHPNVTGTAGYFLDPYESAGVSWPSRGPLFVAPDGTAHRQGTYWSGSDTVNGFTAHARGYVMYLAMAAQPPGWTSKGIDIFVDGDGKARYPMLGAPPRYMEAGLNWEASGHQAADWQETYYTLVPRWDPQIDRDLQVAVMMDVGRDGVPVVASADTFQLPNWQASTPSQTPHIRHAIAIVGYDNTANPPTYSYVDTCGRGCNSRPGNRNGQVHVISQAQMVTAIAETYGMGFIW
jgi:hypothetical protein